jgi:hypothetical protein
MYRIVFQHLYAALFPLLEFREAGDQPVQENRDNGSTNRCREIDPDLWGCDYAIRLLIHLEELHAEDSLRQVVSCQSPRKTRERRTVTRVHGRYMSVITVMNTADFVKSTILVFCSCATP